MTSASLLVHRACGSPDIMECTSFNGQCWHCGAHMTRGMSVAKWQGAQFVGQNRVKFGAGTHICEACVWVMARASEVPGHPSQPGQTCGPNWRNFSVFYDDNGLVTASKGEKPAIRDWLTRSRLGMWFAAIGESGQKHVIPYAPINVSPTGGRLQFEEEIVQVSDWTLLHETCSFLTAGATKEEIESGAYGGAWQRCSTEVRRYERRWEHLRGGAWFRMIVWLSQRDETAVAARMESENATREARRSAHRDVERIDHRGDSRPSSAVLSQRSKPAKPLGSAQDSSARVRETVVRSARVVLADASKASARSPVCQLGLWD